MQPRAPTAESEATAAHRAHPPPPASVAAAAAPRRVALLGRGGSSEVWYGVDAAGGAVALKLWRGELRERPGARAWLEREHATLTRLRDPAIVASYGVVEVDGFPALLLEYLAGGDLVSLAGGPARHWLGAALTLARTLRFVHDRGVVHGDVKARNVLFDAADRVRLADFAAALPIGARRPATGRRALPSDDYRAYAALLLELITGRPVDRRQISAIEPAVAPLRDVARVAAAGLVAEGRVATGLLTFEDVLESAIAANSPV